MKPLYVMVEDDIYEALRKMAFDKHVSLASIVRGILKNVHKTEKKIEVEDESKKILVEEDKKVETYSDEGGKVENINLPEPEEDEFNPERLSKSNFIAKGRKRL